MEKAGDEVSAVRRSVTVKRGGKRIGGSQREVGQVITVRQVTDTKCSMAAESKEMTSLI